MTYLPSGHHSKTIYYAPENTDKCHAHSYVYIIIMLHIKNMVSTMIKMMKKIRVQCTVRDEFVETGVLHRNIFVVNKLNFHKRSTRKCPEITSTY